MRKYTRLDLLKFRTFANANPKLQGSKLINAYDKKHPELTSKEQLINLSKAFKLNNMYKSLTGEDLKKEIRKVVDAINFTNEK